MSFKFTILGCGSSSGVPRTTGDWGACDPSELKNRRRRCAMLVQKFSDNGVTSIIVDTGPDIHHQLIDLSLGEIDGVIITHEHADHTHGMDDLRAFAQDSQKQIKVHMTAKVFNDVNRKFEYCFKQAVGSLYPPILKHVSFEFDKQFTIDGAGGVIEILPVKLTHGPIDAAGFLINDVMYSPDVNAIPGNSEYAFIDLDLWIIDSLRPYQHVSHFSVNDALEMIEKHNPKQAILTNMTVELDYQILKDQVSKDYNNVSPAFDGMIFEN